MLRGIGGVLVGYITIVVLIFGLFTLAWTLMKSDGAFQEGVYEVSMTWCIATLIVGLIAATLGGLVCALIAGGQRAVTFLAGLVLVLGLLVAVGALTQTEDPRPAERAGDVSMMDAMTNARQPTWITFVNPVIGVVGVMLGGRLRPQRKTAES